MSGTRADILIVDDEKANLIAITAVLQKLDVEVVTASSGDEALRHVLQRDFALILMDVKMPGMDGLETASIIRQRPRCARTPLIFITASRPDEERAFDGYRLGAVDYIYKPIVPALLCAKVSVFVELHKKTHELLEMKRVEHQRELEEVRVRLEARNMREETEATRKLADQLARTNLELEHFAYAASHDLKEPLRTVASYLNLLSRRYGDRLDDDGRELVAFATDGAKRMAKLVDDLLLYSRVANAPLDDEELDLNEMMERVTTSLHAAIEETGAGVVARELPKVRANRTQVGQLLQNLVGNAIKYRGADAPRVEVTAERRDGEWVFAVKDNGIGFDMKYAERIFVIFQRLHAREEYAGTGVGLAICKKIVERRGGKIWADAQPGHGATFYFTIPENDVTLH